MSLDFTIKSDKVLQSSGTGIFVRDSGGTRELKTLDEIITYFPDFDINNLKEENYETNVLWSGNITHNLGCMASHVPVKNSNLYYYLWRPSEIGFDYLSSEFIEGIKEGYEYLDKNKINLEKYNPENNCGSYEVLKNFVKSLLDCISNVCINYSDEFQIIISR